MFPPTESEAVGGEFRVMESSQRVARDRQATPGYVMVEQQATLLAGGVMAEQQATPSAGGVMAEQPLGWQREVAAGNT